MGEFECRRSETGTGTYCLIIRLTVARNEGNCVPYFNSEYERLASMPLATLEPGSHKGIAMLPNDF